MARQESRRVNSNRRANYGRPEGFEDGNAVRRIDVVPEETWQQEELKPGVTKQTRKNRMRATRMGAGYVFFLAVVCFLSVAMCVAYVRMQTTITTQTREIAGKEKELSDLKADNDAYYNTTVASVDLEAVKEAAISRLGMKYAGESQMITFSTSGNSYVRQYQNVPES